MDKTRNMIPDGDWLFSANHIVATKRIPDSTGKTESLIIYLDHPFINAATFDGEQAHIVWDWLIQTRGLAFDHTDPPAPAGCDKRAFFGFLTMYFAFLRTRVKIIDADPDTAQVELKCPDGTRDWYSLEDAATILAQYHRFQDEDK
jgi:hypothetical protein